MLRRVKVLLISATAHVWLYTIPRFIHSVLVRLPVTFFELLAGVRPLTYSFKRERHIAVVTTSRDAAAKKEIQRLCGLHEDMQYTGPMYNGLLSTVLGSLRLGRRVAYERELVEADDGNPICLDWLRVPPEGESHVKGVVLLVPGFGNYGQTPFIQQIARETTKRGYHVCVLTPRGMGSAPLTRPRLTCVAFTSDVRKVLREHFTKEEVMRRFGSDLPLYAMGYSAGASTLIKSIAEETSTPDFAQNYPHGFPVRLCVAMNGPFDMAVHARAMLSRVGRLFFQKPIVSVLRKFMNKHGEVLKYGVSGMKARSPEEVTKVVSEFQTVQDFEEHILCPYMGYPHAVDYYNDVYAPKWARQVGGGVTLLAVATRDDPVVGYGVTQELWQEVADARPNVAYVETPVGGHLGYLRGPIDEFHERPSFLVQFPVDVFDTFTKESAQTGLGRRRS